MKALLRYLLINFVSLGVTTEVVKGLTYTGGLRSLFIGVIAFTLINILLVPLIKVLLLPLNLLTLGLFAWLTNVLALYALTALYPAFTLRPYFFPGYNLGGFTIPAYDLSTLMVVVMSALMIGLITHFLHWLIH